MPRHASLIPAVLTGLLASTLSLSAHAWGFETHRMIAGLAELQLTPAARTQVQTLLAQEPGATLSSISTWADESRDRRTGQWHYVNFENSDCKYDAGRYCADGQCVVDAITEQVKLLRSAAPDVERLVALKFVVHLVADVHQPLHAGFGADKGGNLYQLQIFGKGGNLHSLWDTALVVNRPGGSATIRDELSAQIKATAAPADPAPLDWAIESCKLVAAPDFYPDSRKVDEQYQAAHDADLKARLGAAARRLAAVLNKVFLP